MRTLLLNKTGLNKIRSQHKELKQADVEDSIKSYLPGEWALLHHPTSAQSYVCFLNPNVDDKFTSIHIVSQIESKNTTSFVITDFIKSEILRAYHKRLRFQSYENGSRIFYGAVDGLPGLIIDKFKSKAIIQINTAGIDQYRDLIRNEVEKMIEGEAFLLDNLKYREKEALPVFETTALPNLEIEENGIKFLIRSDVLQKVGFYYDHRENRAQLLHLLNRLSTNFENGLDLFSYVGAWGLMGLFAGVGKMTFVDQGNFENEISTCLKLNGFQNRGEFFRSDVFKFLDDAIQKKSQFDLILCDPPAFAKSQSQKDHALEGYSKLHRKVFRLASPSAFVAFSSCTHYVSHEEFQKNIIDAANKENRKVQLIYSGMQGWDHPISSLMDKSNYIKSYFYLLES